MVWVWRYCLLYKIWEWSFIIFMSELWEASIHLFPLMRFFLHNFFIQISLQMSCFSSDKTNARNKNFVLDEWKVTIMATIYYKKIHFLSLFCLFYLYSIFFIITEPQIYFNEFHLVLMSFCIILIRFLLLLWQWCLI